VYHPEERPSLGLCRHPDWAHETGPFAERGGRWQDCFTAPVKVSYDVIVAAGKAAAEASMRAAGRDTWNADDVEAGRLAAARMWVFQGVTTNAIGEPLVTA
jgi:hypothetical protein